MELLAYFFGAIDRPTLLLALFLIISAVALAISHHMLKKKGCSLKIWRLLCLVPLVLSIVHFLLYQLHGAIFLTLMLYGALYITAFFIALWQFLYKRKYSYRIVAVAINLFAVVGFLTFFSLHSSTYTNINNFTTQSYTESFRSTIKTMQKEYVLSEWKEIDYNALEKEIMPMIKQAEEKQDKIAYGIALLTYAYRFYDGHVAFEAIDVADTEKICDRIAGNDFGFSMITLDNGKTIAVLTEQNSKAYTLGIHDGTVITKWNGIPIDRAKQNIECMYPSLLTFPVAQNEEYFKSIFLAGKGSEEMEVSFLTDGEKEKTITLKSIGNYRTRLECAISRFYHSNIEDENFSCKMLTDNCGYLRIASETYNMLLESAASIKGEYPEITEMLDNKLNTLRASGMDRLIIDLRGNSGGSDFITPAVASLFAKKSYLSTTLGKYRDGKYIPLNTQLEVAANGKYADIPVVVLVNGQCVSSGDGLAENLSLLPNVTLMGITASNGSDQTIGGFCFTTNGEFVIKYPTFMNLDQNGDPRIDTNADRISRIPLDEQIALTKKAALSIFNGKGDYELDYAVDYLNRQ